MSSHLALVVDGREIRRWSRYEVDSDLRVPADAFSLSVEGFRPEDRDLIGLGARCELYVDGQLQLSGRVDSVQLRHSRQGRSLEVSGRDLAADLVDCSAPLGSFHGRTLASVAEELCAPWSIPVVAGGVAATSIVSAGPMRAEEQRVELGIISASVMVRTATTARREEWTVQPGETVWSFLARACKRAGLALWMSPGGELVLARPDYRQAPAYGLVRAAGQSNVLSGSWGRSWAQRYATMFGTRFGGRSSARATAMVEDADLRAAGLHRPLRAQLEAATPAELQAALEADLQERFWASDDLVYVVAGHAQDGLVWRPDSMVQVRDEVLGLDEPRYLVGRRFTMSKREGQRTELRLRRPGVWLP